MLSDDLFAVVENILKILAEHASNDPDYPSAQKNNIIKAVTFLKLAQYKYDTLADDNAPNTLGELKMITVLAKEAVEAALIP